MADRPASTTHSSTRRAGGLRRIGTGTLLLLLGCLALATPFVAGRSAAFVLGLLILTTGLLQTAQAFATGDRAVRRSLFFAGGISLVAGLLLVALPKLALTGFTLLLGLSFLADAAVKIVTALRRTGKPGQLAALIDGAINAVLGLSIALQWPISGAWAIGIFVGIRILATGWSMILGRTEVSEGTGSGEVGLHPDRHLALPAHDKLAKINAAVNAEEEARQRSDRRWRWTFILTFFAIHVGRMDAPWDLVGLISPAVAVAGDLCLALLLAYALVIPLRLAWRALTRPIERRCWQRVLARLDKGQGWGYLLRCVRWWLVGRLRFSLRAKQARRSPTAALRRGLDIGLPWAAILVALNPIWGFTWYFNTENWATGAWEQWAEHRTDAWREEMVLAVEEEFAKRGVAEADLFQLAPEGLAGEGDFSFVVIGDCGEGDASQLVLKDQLLLLGERPDVKFLVVSSDVIYPAGAMKDYEPKFYLPFKGFTKPVYAIPGNHDWYDTLEGFTANFLEPEAARVALRARRRADHGLTTTTERRIEDVIEEAARLRAEYGVRTGWQRAPFFEVQTDGFALVAVDTGILRSVDAEQLRWFRAALERARGKFKFVIPGHPLYAGGRYQGQRNEPFAAIHQLLRDERADIVMAGDTHYFEYYREPYRTSEEDHVMHHFVNGGGGAYLSIGTPLDWPAQPALADSAFYPRTDAIVAKLDRQTPVWKRPIWFWVKHLGGWPSTAESLASAFDFNLAPFFQSFVEVRVERSANVVRIWPYGPNGRLRWRDLQVHGQVIPTGQEENAHLEFRVPLSVKGQHASH
jgi:uncharacterized membrane protein HdeD (DUF308 family)